MRVRVHKRMASESRACPTCVMLKIRCEHKTMTDILSKQTACDECVRLHIKCVHMPTPGAAPGASGTPAKAAAKPAKAAAKPAKAAAKPAKAAAKPAPVAIKRAQEHVPVSSTASQKPAPVAIKRAQEHVPVSSAEQPDLFDSDVDAEMEQELEIFREGLRALLALVPSGEPAPVANEGAAWNVEEVVEGFWASTDEDEEAGVQEPALTEEEQDAAKDFCSALR